MIDYTKTSIEALRKEFLLDAMTQYRWWKSYAESYPRYSRDYTRNMATANKSLIRAKELLKKLRAK